MPITVRQQELASETVAALQQAVEGIRRPIRISPERMTAFHVATRMRMTVNIGDRAVVLEEHEDAPDLAQAISDATESAQAPVLASERHAQARKNLRKLPAKRKR